MLCQYTADTMHIVYIREKKMNKFKLTLFLVLSGVITTDSCLSHGRVGRPSTLDLSESWDHATLAIFGHSPRAQAMASPRSLQRQERFILDDSEEIGVVKGNATKPQAKTPPLKRQKAINLDDSTEIEGTSEKLKSKKGLLRSAWRKLTGKR